MSPRLLPRAGNVALALVCLFVPATAAGGETSRLPDHPIPLETQDFPDRPRPLLELGDGYLRSGKIRRGWHLPTGAIWQPAFLAFGTLRSAAQSRTTGDRLTEWTNRLDLYGNLQLSGSERALVGFRPLDRDGGFTGYTLEPSSQSEFTDRTNFQLTTLFFEGDVGELFPNLDRKDFGQLDYGFSVGRQPISFQAGLLLDDGLDAVGLTRNTLLPDPTSNLRITGLWAWNGVDRHNQFQDDDAQLLGLFTEADFPQRTVALDVVYVTTTSVAGDGLHWGISSVRRWRSRNLTGRLLGSHALDGETSAVGNGYLGFGEFSWTPARSEDIVYLDGFVAVDRFTSAARGPGTAGPLGRTGILFSGVGLGRYGAPIGNESSSAFGTALGRQFFSHDTRTQFVAEIGGRRSTLTSGQGRLGLGARYQRAFGRRTVLQLDGVGALDQSTTPLWASRVEMRLQL